MSTTTTTEASPDPDEQKPDLIDPEALRVAKTILSLPPEAQSTLRRLLIRLRNREG